MNLEHTQLNKIRIVIGVVFFLTILTQLNDNAFNLITPILEKTFSISTEVASWAASIGGVGVAIGFLAFSSFSDFFNEKKLLICGILLFCLPSVTGILFQNNYNVVVFSRFIQAVGGISTSALYLVLVARYLPIKEQVIWIGLSTTSFSLSTVIGTLAGGFFSTYLGWQFIFYIPFIALLAIPVIYKFLPNKPKGKNNLDYTGFFILAAFSIGLNFLISKPSPVLFIGVIILAAIFVLHMKRAQNPFVSLGFIKNKNYMCTLAATLFYYLAQVALVFLTPFLLQSLFEYSMEKVSLVFILPYTLSGILAAFSGTIINKIGMRKTIYLGAFLIISGFVFAGFFSEYGISFVLAALCLITGGYSFSFSPLISGAISSLDETEVGVGIGLFNFIVRISNALGISVSAALLNTRLVQTNILGTSDKLYMYTNVFLILAAATFIGIVMYRITNRKYAEMAA